MFTPGTRGRGRGRGWGYRGARGPRGRYASTRRETEPTPAPPLGPLLESISSDELSSKGVAGPMDNAHITNCEVMASYSWLDKSSPSILVPGMPPKWTPPSEPRKLREDSGVYFRDRNSARYPAHPMEPSVNAVMEMSPTIAGYIDLVACSSTLGGLLHFIRGNPQPCRMLVEVVGDTVHLIRRESSPREAIPGVRGYGHTFPESYTTWDASVRGSESHYRVLRYDFGGLACLMRFGVDGYLPDKAGKLKITGMGASVSDEAAAIEPLAASLRLTTTNSSSSTTADAAPLCMSTAGELVPQRAIFDLKTRSIRRKPDQDVILEEELPRMWLAQIPNFILAYHTFGEFTDVQVQDVHEKIEEWETEKQDELVRFSALLHRIIRLARGPVGGGKLEIVRAEGQSTVEIREQVAGIDPAFNSETETKWAAWLGEGGDWDDDDGSQARNDGGVLLHDGSDDDSDRYQLDDDSDGSMDYTACGSDCGYCGHCSY